jgi:hypothetical protein
MKTIIGYKFIQSDMKSQSGDCGWKIGEWKKHEGYLKLCNSGFHACIRPLDSLGYVYGDRWFIVEARGKIRKGKDKFVASEMRLTKELDVKKILPWFAIACARRSLKYYEKQYPDDKRPLDAIEAAEKYLKNPTKENLEVLNEKISAAWSARWAQSAARWAASAAWSAWSARSAAWSAESAAQSAWSARSAAWWARSAARWARSAERRWQNRMLEKIIREAMK